MAKRLLRFVVLGGVAAAFAFVPLAQARPQANLIIDVNYAYDGSITVTLPNGTAVGVKSGTPTMIPAGYYTVELTQPGCVDTPAFILQGPGVNILDDMQAGEIVTDAQAAVFQPNATYTWRDGSINPPVLWTFQTSSDVLGTPPPPAVNANGPRSKNAQVNEDVVNSAKLPFRGKLAAVVKGGKVGLTFKGKSVASLASGRYTITVDDASKTQGVMLAGGSSHRKVRITTGAFVGKVSKPLVLTAGKWSLTGGAGFSVK
jgi:hypothetical protein